MLPGWSSAGSLPAHLGNQLFQHPCRPHQPSCLGCQKQGAVCELGAPGQPLPAQRDAGKGDTNAPALSPSLAQHCSSGALNNQQKIMALRFSFLLHTLLKDLVGNKREKRKDEKEALGPLETSAPSQCCSAQAKHLSLNSV